MEEAVRHNCSAEEIEKRQADWHVQAKLATYPDAIVEELTAKGSFELSFLIYSLLII